MKIEVWSDFVCPFCYIGKRHLENALNQFEHKNDVEVSFRSFQLSPDTPKNIDLGMHEALAKKYGISVEEAKKMTQQVVAQAKTVGLEYNLDNAKASNTEDAHRLAYFAKHHGKDKEMTERLLKAYFTDSLDIGKQDTLVKLADEVGLGAIEVKQMLESNSYQEDILGDQALASQIGVRGVPFFVFNNKYAVSGAQPVSAFSEVLQKVWEEERGNKIEILQSEADKDTKNVGVCTDESCEL